jgi:hypothetical protein
LNRSRIASLAALVGLTPLLLANTCTIGSGDGTPFGLNMPWFHQEKYYYCVPAAIQMWAAYDGNRVSQTTIAAYVGAVQPGGTPAPNVAPGVARFTATTDAFFEDAFFSDQAQFSSMQITSISNGRPLIAVFSQEHVVIPSGGSWHYDSSNGWNVWDTVVYQDPAGGPDLVATGGEWMNEVTSMVIGSSATAGFKAYLNQYGDSVRVRGSTYRPPPRQL